MTFHVKQPGGESIDLIVARLCRRSPAPLYWQDQRGRWIAYQGRGIYELGEWGRAGKGWQTHRRIQPLEEWGT